MSVALPMRVMEVFSDFKGLVELDGVRRGVSLAFVDNCQPGDYVIVHAGFAIEKMDHTMAAAALNSFSKTAPCKNPLTEESDNALVKYIEEYRDPQVASGYIDTIVKQCSELAGRQKPVRIMEVNGSHTMAIGRYGIRAMLPDYVELISGPGCPICVTDPGYIDTAVALADKGVIVAGFEDILRIPGSDINLTECRAEGGDVRVCHSPAGAIDLARENPGQSVVFLAIGFEATIASVIGAVDMAAKSGLKNLSFLTAFKSVKPALKKILADKELNIDAILCPPYVSSIIGARAYESIASEYKVPCVIAGSEPVDILKGTQAILDQLIKNESCVENLYSRVVRPEGNCRAQGCIEKYLKKVDAYWRGIGTINSSGFAFRDEYSSFDAEKRFGMPMLRGKLHSGCRCNDVIKGKIRPLKCGLFGDNCNPSHPLGPCMVSSEGTCAAYFKYGLNNR